MQLSSDFPSHTSKAEVSQAKGTLSLVFSCVFWHAWMVRRFLYRRNSRQSLRHPKVVRAVSNFSLALFYHHAMTNFLCVAGVQACSVMACRQHPVGIPWPQMMIKTPYENRPQADCHSSFLHPNP